MTALYHMLFQEMALVDIKLGHLDEDAFADMEGSLRTLYIVNCHLSSLPRSVFAGLPSLLHLEVKDMQSRILRNHSFKNATNLRHLVFQNMGLSVVEPFAFDGLANLRRLNLRRNKLQIIDCLKPLTNLTFLNLEGNQINSIYIEEFPVYCQISIIRLDKNSLAHFFSENKSENEYVNDKDGSHCNQNQTDPSRLFIHLKKLHLEQNPIQLQSGNFLPFPFLEGLTLFRSDLTRLPSGLFCGLSRLKTLNLAYNALRMLRAGVFAPLNSLRALYLSHNHILTIEAGAIAPMTNLQILHLDNNMLQSPPREAWVTPRHLHVYDNPLQCSCSLLWLLQLNLTIDWDSTSRNFLCTNHPRFLVKGYLSEICNTSQTTVPPLTLAESGDTWDRLQETSPYVRSRFFDALFAASVGFVLVIGSVAFVLLRWSRRRKHRKTENRKRESMAGDQTNTTEV